MFLVSKLRRYWREEHGSTTVEMVLWIPAFFYLFVMIADASFIFYGKSQTLQILQDANRALSVGAIDSEAALESRVNTLISGLGYSGIVDAIINSTTGIVTTKVVVPANQLTAVGSIPGLSNFELAIVSSHYLEQ
ncbi:TadE/TadG family type IV pilus assembly protein [Loktanella sp. SALINAS62]|uniref:TadE/TadG family type IV pilus assembly protein n=1 Tax=Loktanella sp. SALINAS62 TaxID=2706124 RepID=UPI001B8B22D2|nr:TadE/TadG family type IV pilus assembly protein [Loktanella sp. SALINAS62]MBS1303490.1 hypothetical protein [Loktanella sp. SALINAS62]